MVDNDLIQSVSNHLINALDNKNKITNELFSLSNLLPNNACNKLSDYVRTVDDTMWMPNEKPESEQFRRQIFWHSDSVIEELHYALDNITHKINEIFPKSQKQNFIGLILWEDTENYFIDWHYDNPMLSTSMQIYLFDSCPAECGTSFCVNNESIDIPFVHSSGYLLDQSAEPTIEHKTTKPVPHGVKRYSLYANWSFEKKLPN